MILAKWSFQRPGKRLTPSIGRWLHAANVHRGLRLPRNSSLLRLCEVLGEKLAHLNGTSKNSCVVISFSQ